MEGRSLGRTQSWWRLKNVYVCRSICKRYTPVSIFNAPLHSLSWKCAVMNLETSIPCFFCALLTHSSMFLLTAESFAISYRGEVCLTLKQNNSALVFQVLWKTSLVLAALKGQREREKPCDGAEWRQEIHFSVDTTSLTFLYLWFFSPVFSLWTESTGELKLGNLFRS